jgi:hypothetical protein
VSREDNLEAALVVVVTLVAVVVLAAYVDDGVALGEEFRIARADELGVEVCGQQAQHGNCQRLIGVEVATVPISLLSNGGMCNRTCVFQSRAHRF